MEDYVDKKIEKRKEKSKDLSPEDKAKLFKKANRSQSRKDMAPKALTQRLISIKAGRNRQRIEELESTVAILVGKVQYLELKVDPPPEVEEKPNKELPEAFKPYPNASIDRNDPKYKGNKEKCPKCGKMFKQIKRHKCKGK